jgi:hypothetical protein
MEDETFSNYVQKCLEDEKFSKNSISFINYLEKYADTYVPIKKLEDKD